MSISIVSCPKCNTFLLSDTAQCHRCRHVLHEDRAEQFRDASLPSDAAIQQDSERCRQCGETYRKGLVRCWSCGAFTRPEIEDAYYRLLQGHAQHVDSVGQHYELPEITTEQIRLQYQAEDRQQAAESAVRTQEFAALDEDFELSGNLRLLEDQLPMSVAAPLVKTPSTNGVTNHLAVENPVPQPAVEPNVKSELSKPAPSKPVTDEAASLFKQAREEETAQQKVRKARIGDGFVIFCPMGCKIRVQERHRGKIGRCPKCQSTFVVPMARQTAISGAMPPNAAEGAGSGATGTPARSDTSSFATWMQDLHFHKVVPQKLRIKADSLLKEFQPVDVGFDFTGVVLVGLATGGGMFGGKDAKKIDAARTAAQDHLRTTGKSEGLSAPFKQDFDAAAVYQFALSQPSPPGAESLFGDIPIFGTARVAVRLPKFDDKFTGYLSFTLSQFREFAEYLAQNFGISRFGAGCGIPLTDEYKTETCHVSKKSVRDLQNLTWYQKDPAFKLEISGYRCKTCAAVIGEPARAAQKLGGPAGKAIAKAKCPKCTKPLGNQPLYVAPGKTVKSSASDDVEQAETDTPAAETPRSGSTSRCDDLS